MMLSDNFERSRAGQSPGRDVLDRNADRIIDAQELDGAVSVLRRCDTNQNEIVEASEIRNAAASLVHDSVAWDPPKLVIALNDLEAINHSFRRLVTFSKVAGATALLASFATFLR